MEPPLEASQFPLPMLISIARHWGMPAAMSWGCTPGNTAVEGRRRRRRSCPAGGGRTTMTVRVAHNGGFWGKGATSVRAKCNKIISSAARSVHSSHCPDRMSGEKWSCLSRAPSFQLFLPLLRRASTHYQSYALSDRQLWLRLRLRSYFLMTFSWRREGRRRRSRSSTSITSFLLINSTYKCQCL